jgi:hypothetical protein
VTSMVDPELRQELEEQRLGLEEAAVAAVTAGLVSSTALAVRQWLAAVSAGLAAGSGVLAPDTVTALRRKLVLLVSGIRPGMSARLSELVARGVQLGVEQSSRIVGESIKVTGSPYDPTLGLAVEGIDSKARTWLDEVSAQARSARIEGYGDAAKLAGAVTSVATRAKTHAAWAVNRSVSAGVSAAARERGDRLLWVAERNACLHCLALSGETAMPGTPFPDVTFAETRSRIPVPPYPPRHPHCRCSVEPYSGPEAVYDRSDPSPSSVLKREAERSVLRGLTDYASNRAAVRAAELMLRRGSVLAPSVLARAERDVERKKFTRRPA